MDDLFGISGPECEARGKSKAENACGSLCSERSEICNVVAHFQWMLYPR